MIHLSAISLALTLLAAPFTRIEVAGDFDLAPITSEALRAIGLTTLDPNVGGPGKGPTVRAAQGPQAPLPRGPSRNADYLVTCEVANEGASVKMTLRAIAADGKVLTELVQSAPIDSASARRPAFAATARQFAQSLLAALESHAGKSAVTVTVVGLKDEASAQAFRDMLAQLNGVTVDSLHADAGKWVFELSQGDVQKLASALSDKTFQTHKINIETVMGSTLKVSLRR